MEAKGQHLHCALALVCMETESVLMRDRFSTGQLDGTKYGLKYEIQRGCHVVNCAKVIQIVAIDQSLIASLLF